MTTRILIRNTYGVFKSLYNESVRNTVISRLSSTYKAAVIDGKEDEPFKITEIKSPKKLKKGQVRIKVKACTFNAWDYAVVSGKRASDIRTPGYEISGEVVEIAESDDFGKGDKVIAYNRLSMGGFSEQVVVDEKDVWMKPSNVRSEEGCTLLESYGNAVLGLAKQTHLTEKQNVLVTLAMAHGYAPVDIAANVYKAKVLAVCESEGEHTTELRERGAWSALAYKDKTLLAAVKDLTKGEGISLAYCTMSGPPLLSALASVSQGGRVLYSGSEDLPVISADNLLSLPTFSLSPVSLWSTRNHNLEKYREVISDVIEMREQGLISPAIAAKYKLEDINQAYLYLKEKRPLGKVVILVDD